MRDKLPLAPVFRGRYGTVRCACSSTKIYYFNDLTSSSISFLSSLSLSLLFLLKPNLPPTTATIPSSNITMSSSLDQLKATGTVVVSDSGDFACQSTPPSSPPFPQNLSKTS